MSKVLVDQELLPCPFCGQQDAFVEQLDSDASVVICQGVVDEHSACLARGPVGVQQSEMEDQPGRDAAIAEWNRRAQPAEAEGVGDWSGLRLAAKAAEEDWPWEPHICMTDVEKAFAQSVSPTKVLELISALSAVTAERDRLQGEIQSLRGSMEFRSSLIGRTEAERDQLLAEVEALRKDAERYRWLRQMHESRYGLTLTIARVGMMELTGWSGDDPDSVIDAAMAAKDRP